MSVPTLEYAEVWEGNTKFVKKLEILQLTAAKKALGCSNTTSIVAPSAEHGMYPLETSRDVRKLNGNIK